MVICSCRMSHKWWPVLSGEFNRGISSQGAQIRASGAHTHTVLATVTRRILNMCTRVAPQQPQLSDVTHFKSTSSRQQAAGTHIHVRNQFVSFLTMISSYSARHTAHWLTRATGSGSACIKTFAMRTYVFISNRKAHQFKSFCVQWEENSTNKNKNLCAPEFPSHSLRTESQLAS